ncbi:MAG: hypothetical protein V4754_17195 [Pseudomonadota bacterium]
MTFTLRIKVATVCVYVAANLAAVAVLYQDTPATAAMIATVSFG